MTTRREVLSTLAALPAVASVERLGLGPRDMLVLKLAHHVSMAELEETRATLHRLFPGVSVLVLAPGVDLQVVRAEKAP